MLEIIITPNSTLLKHSEEVKRFDSKLSDVIDQMKQTLDATTDPIGVGLAAPQVGLSQRIFVAKPKDGGKHFVFINPVIASSLEGEVSKKQKKLLEGCLSIPTIWGRVRREKEVTVEYQDEKGKKHVRHFKGFLATIIQHETDHLDGILFTKHVLTQGEKLYKSHKNDKGEDEFDEIKV